ncbi:MAG TPA: amidohydrolase family protein [Thermoanaerobaculia bacterium]|nr:amidohydrolase family protein [Thermoanaerobaculia bacterium]
MKKSALAAAVLTLSAAAFAQNSALAPGKPIVLKAARMFDGRSDRTVSPGLVVVENGKIASVGGNAPPGAEVIDLGDATLLPGFIDAHVHLMFQASDNWFRDFFQRTMRFPAEQAHYAAMYARRTLEAGFTTVRDVGSWDHVALGLRNAIAAGVAEGPRMLVSNNPIGATGGHADGEPFPPDLVKPSGPLDGVCNGPDECRAAVRYQIKYGADVIKCMPSGGVLSLSDPVDAPELTQEEMNAIVSEAHAWGRKVAAHCHGDAAAKIAIAAGVDSIEHGSFIKPDTLALMKKKGTYLVPTLYAGDWVGKHADQFPPAIAAKARAASAAMTAMFREAVRQGVKVAFGTDAGVEPHGGNAHEFVLMTQDGLSPAAALRAGTSSAADLLGVAGDSGTLESGKRADIVAVPGDPTADIAATGKVLFVMQQGRIVKNVRP